MVTYFKCRYCHLAHYLYSTTNYSLATHLIMVGQFTDGYETGVDGTNTSLD